MSNGPRKNWANIDGHLWLSCGLSGDLTAIDNQQHLVMNTIIKDFALGLPVHMPIHVLNAKWPILHAHVVCIWSRGTLIQTVPTMRPNQHHFSRWAMGITVQIWCPAHFNWPDHLSLMLLANKRECWDHSFQGHILLQGLIFGPKPDLRALGRTPINVPKLQELLLEYLKKSDATFLLNGFQSGFKLNFEGPRLPIDCNNLKSIKDTRNSQRKKSEWS